ncbi:MAG: 16S rRNA (cytidine(1402)-2'-O)-methyltransferase [Rubrimonas sp.]
MARDPGSKREADDAVPAGETGRDAAGAAGGDNPKPLAPGLYLVATPIGAADDVTLRALDILARADVIAAEDTRRARHLMDIHGIALRRRPLIPYHDHNGAAQRPGLLARIRDGRSVALVSDAGTPLVADPGWRLAREAIDAGLAVTAAPGASAVLAALSIAGLPTDRFLFAGFPPTKTGERARFLAEFAAVPATLVFYESPRRLGESLAAMRDAFGDRPAAVCRELTTRFEEARRGGLAALAETYADHEPRGEIVVVVGPPAEAGAAEADIDAMLAAALKDATVKDAARAVAEALGAPRKAVYARALALAGKAP